MNSTETIVALATPVGESAIAAIRVSGPASPTLLKGMPGIPKTGLIPRRTTRVRYRTLREREVDDLLVVHFSGPASYTGEDILEIYPHGNPFLVETILKDLLERGCRMAEPGEFTKRAFLNGKMDLTQAEAVMDLIHSRSEQAAEAARRQLDGRLGKHLNLLIDRLLQVCASIEAYIDFPEEDLPEEDEASPLRQLAEIIAEVDLLIASEPYRARLSEGVRVALLGETNAGKSSLLNALVADDRAIVSPIPGTTRDFLEVVTRFGEFPAVVVDTAGLRESSEIIEVEGMARTQKQAERADLVLLVRDATRPSPRVDSRLLALLEGKPVIVLENKGDLPGWAEDPSWFPGAPRLRVSATTGMGLNSLRERVLQHLKEGLVLPAENAVLVSARHANALRRVKVSLDGALQKAQAHEGIEFMASDLRDSLDAFGEITGAVDNERMLDHLFATFCIGK